MLRLMSLCFIHIALQQQKCKGRCNDINDLSAKLCVLDTLKNINTEVFNLMSRVNETRHIEWHRTCKCKCRLDASVCYNKQRLTKEHVIRDLFIILVIVSVNVINHGMLENI